MNWEKMLKSCLTKNFSKLSELYNDQNKKKEAKKKCILQRQKLKNPNILRHNLTKKSTTTNDRHFK